MEYFIFNRWMERETSDRAEAERVARLNAAAVVDSDLNTICDYRTQESEDNERG